jgi:hypothetical protein
MTAEETGFPVSKTCINNFHSFQYRHHTIIARIYTSNDIKSYAHRYIFVHAWTQSVSLLDTITFPINTGSPYKHYILLQQLELLRMSVKIYE